MWLELDTFRAYEHFYKNILDELLPWLLGTRPTILSLLKLGTVLDRANHIY